MAKSNHLMLFMPIWGEEECQKCKDSCYPEISNDELKDLFHKWGGSQRFLFAHIRRDELLNDFLRSANLEAMIATMEDINRPVDSADRCQWVKHIQVGRHTDGRPDYTVSEWEWPSQFVMKEVRKALDEHEANWRASHRLTTDSLLLGKLY